MPYSYLPGPCFLRINGGVIELVQEDKVIMTMTPDEARSNAKDLLAAADACSGGTPEPLLHRLKEAGADKLGQGQSIPDSDEVLLGELLSGFQDFMTVSSALSGKDFPRPEHKLIWQSMKDLYERGEPINRVRVANELMKDNLLEVCGGLTYIVQLADYGSGVSYELDAQ